MKYFTNELKLQNANNGEKFILANQAAQNEKSYDSWHDVERLENFILQKEIDKGFKIWLTNNSFFIDCDKINKESQYFKFQICDGRKIGQNDKNELDEHCLKWEGKMKRKNRLDPIYVSGNYTIKWEDYSNLKQKINKNKYNDLIDKNKSNDENYKFRFALLTVSPFI